MAIEPWVSPTIDRPVLHLPILNDATANEWSLTQKSPQNISISVTPDFIAAYTQRPLSDSASDIAAAIAAMTPTFMTLICSGREQVHTDTKTHPADFVTDMDLGIEMLLRMWINRFFPSDLIIGEEGSKPAIGKSDTVWYLDPVDGTNNYVKGSPMVGLNIGVLKAGKPFVSCIGLPFQNQFFIGNCETRQVTKWQDGKAELFHFHPYSGPLILGTEFSWDHHLEQTQKIAKAANAEMLRTKSICQNLTQLLLGNLSAFYKVNVKLWDIIAPLCILEWATNDYFTLSLIFPPEGNQYVIDELIFDHPFSNSDALIQRLNHVHAGSCKSGIILVAPHSFSHLKDLVFEQYVA